MLESVGPVGYVIRKLNQVRETGDTSQARLEVIEIIEALILALVAVATAWSLTHTSYTLRYAHLYYRDEGGVGGLVFPGDRPPDDFDFAYFACTIGMCFQVSDVVIVS